MLYTLYLHIISEHFILGPVTALKRLKVTLLTCSTTMQFFHINAELPGLSHCPSLTGVSDELDFTEPRKVTYQS